MKYVGIDVSQDHLDFALLDEQGGHLASAQVANSHIAFRRLVKNWTKQYGLVLTESLFCLEPTGHYSHLSLHVLVEELQAPTWLAHPVDIQQSLGVQRGKSDSVDALRIAQYAFRFRDKARMFTADQLKMNKLKELLMKRRQLVESRSKLQVQISNVTPRLHKDLRSELNYIDKTQLRLINRLLKRVESAIQVQIQDEQQLKRQYDLMISVPGVGPVLAANLLALTDAFTRFTTPRALACHAGAAPFEHSSGSSVRGRTRTSKKANAALKSLLHLAAIVSIKRDAQIRAYYDRKRAEGKPALCVINAIRAKVIHRVFAVLRRGEPFEFTPLPMS